MQTSSYTTRIKHGKGFFIAALLYGTLHRPLTLFNLDQRLDVAVWGCLPCTQTFLCCFV